MSIQKIIYIGLLVFLSSCTKDFEDINKNPFSPTQTDIGPLFNTIVSGLRLGWEEQFYLHNERLYDVTQLAARTAVGFDNVTIGTENSWRSTYQGLVHIREIEQRLDEMATTTDPEALNNVRAQLKVLTAYRIFRLTDLFGAVPFFEAGKGFQSLDALRVKFDSQEEIYKFLLNELQWVEDNINTFPEPVTATGVPYFSLGTFDQLFQNDLMQWRKFANALRLRHALRMVEKDPAFAEPILKDIIENDLPVIEQGEDVVMLPKLQEWRNDGVNWSFREHKRLRMGSNIWRLLSENDNTDGSGIFDPRVRIWFEPNNAGEWAVFPQHPDENTPSAGGIPYQEHRDVNYAVKGTDNIYSPFNYYLIRDPEDIPEIILTGAEVQMIKAEVYLRGLGVAMNVAQAESDYTLGVVASITFWQNIMTNSTIWVNQPSVLSQGEIFNVTNHPSMSIFTNENKLELIYTQRWLDAFRQPWEAYALMRRTNGQTPLIGSIPEHYRFVYPPSERENNPDEWAAQQAKMGGDVEQVKVWWME